MKKSYLDQWGPLITLLYGGLVVYYYSTGLLNLLVNPIYNKLILASGLILFLLGLYWLKNQKNYKPGHCGEGQGASSQIALLALLITPLLFGILFKPQLLSSASALLRGISSDLAVSDFDPVVFAKPTEELTLLEWVRILNLDPEPSHYAGQKLSIEGNVILDENLPENSFHLGRYLLTCCVADARPVGLIVEFDPALYEPINDSWIRVDGHIKEGLINGNRQVVIRLDAAEFIPIPDDAYELFD